MDEIINILKKQYRTRAVLWRSFLSGLFFVLGTTIGVAIFIAFLTFIINQLRTVPALREIIDRIRIQRFLPQR